ncbi:MAG: shikimate kinase [Candidatus Nanopelagicaceae bacterium]|jgi:shikimate kinase
MVVDIVLIGPPGSGKSSVGKALSRKLSRPWIDTDTEVESRAGKKISEIFLEDGEATFRAIESDVVDEVMGSEAGIVSLGGGSVLNEASQKRITTAKEVVFLDVSISNAAPRVGFNKDRPLLAINPRQQWLQLMEKRRPIYESLATITVSTDNKKPDQVADEIIEAIEQRVG